MWRTCPVWTGIFGCLLAQSKCSTLDGSWICSPFRVGKLSRDVLSGFFLCLLSCWYGLSNSGCSLCSLGCGLCSLGCSLCSLGCSLCSLGCSLCSLGCSLCSLGCSLCLRRTGAEMQCRGRQHTRSPWWLGWIHVGWSLVWMLNSRGARTLAVRKPVLLFAPSAVISSALHKLASVLQHVLDQSCQTSFLCDLE